MVCLCSIQSFDPSIPSLGRPRVVPAAPNFSHLGQHQSFTNKRPLNTHSGQHDAVLDQPCAVRRIQNQAVRGEGATQCHVAQ